MVRLPRLGCGSDFSECNVQPVLQKSLKGIEIIPTGVLSSSKKPSINSHHFCFSGIFVLHCR